VHRISCAVLLAVAAIAACKKGDGAPACGAVGANFVIIVHASTTKVTLDPSAQRGLEAQLPAMRDSLVNQCVDGGWSADVRRCLAEAKDHVVFEECEQHLTDAQRQRLASETK
jgi:hypothetical protein